MTLRRLWIGERWRLCEHLLRLPVEDLRLRFCGGVSRDFVTAYCEALDWNRRVVLGYFHEGELRGAVELVHVDAGWPPEAEIAVSVEPPFRERGVATLLVRAALLVARNRYIETVHMMCLPENTAVRRLAVSLNGQLRFRPGDVEGRIRRPWPSYFSVLEEFMSDGESMMWSTFDLLSTLAPAMGSGDARH